MALFRGDEENAWFPGRVTARHTGDDGSGSSSVSYDVTYDDGDTDKGLHESHVSTNVARFDDKL